VNQPDSPEPQLPELVDLLVRLQDTRTSIYIKRDQDFINVTPEPTQELFDMLVSNFHEVQTLLPGYCDACDTWAVRRLEAYWGAHPHLCQSCTNQALQYFERTQRWPEMQVPDTL
jgi:hypothetical protein